MSDKTLKLIKYFYVMALAVPFLLSACGGTIEPGPMPTGYKYHNGVYKAPPGAEPAFWEKKSGDAREADSQELAPLESGGSQTDGMGNLTAGMSAEAAAWLPASRELVSRIKSRLGYPVEPTFIEGMDGKSIPGFEAALRSATSEQGWPQAASRGAGPFHLAYSAVPSDPSNPSRMLLTVRLTVSANNFVIEESGSYTVGTSEAVPAADPLALSPTP